MSDVKLIHRWEYDGQEFPNKRAVQEYKAEQVLARYSTVSDLIANADAVIDALKPFATPKRRKSKAGNGATKGKRSAATAEATV
jgi:hypothetical protein